MRHRYYKYFILYVFMSKHYGMIARSLIALLFVVAGVQKAMNFTGTVGMVESLNVPLATLAALLVIIVEVPVALAFAWGYKVKETGWTLIAFTIIATLLVHFKVTELVAALKNIAIIGGIMLAIRCDTKH